MSNLSRGPEQPAARPEGKPHFGPIVIGSWALGTLYGKRLTPIARIFDHHLKQGNCPPCKTEGDRVLDELAELTIDPIRPNRTYKGPSR